MKLDVLDFMQLATRTTQNVGAWDVRTPIDPKTGYGQIKRLKALGKDGRADTWDLNLYDDSFVYSWITELAYHTPRDYKKFVGNHLNPKTNKYEDGIIMFPRWVDPIKNNFEYVTDKAHSTYLFFKNCRTDSKVHDLGIVGHVLQGPFDIDLGGNMGRAMVMVHQYFWMDNGVPACEENWYAKDKGWVRWCLKHQDPSTSLYNAVHLNNKVVLHNNVLSGGAPEVNFPCF